VLSLVPYDANGSYSGARVLSWLLVIVLPHPRSSPEDIDGEAANDQLAILLTCPRTVLVLSLVLIMMPTEVPLDMRGSLSWLLVIVLQHPSGFSSERH
jgi:hypothetical protein